MTARPVTDAISKNKRIQVVSAGEYYAVCCPKCGDTRHRLWINHRYNTEFEGVKLTGKACCYNERCEQTKGFFDDLNRKIASREPLSTYTPVDTVSNEPFIHPNVPLPGFCRSLDLLEETHLANEYIRRCRGFDPKTLQEDWGVCWCEYSDDFKEASHRLIIPVGDETGMIGWQARYVGSNVSSTEFVADATGATTNPPGSESLIRHFYEPSGVPPAGVAKFHTMPGMKKSHIVFNLSRAKTYGSCPVITEGPFDAMRVGKEHGLALFGTSISAHQRQLLAKAYTGKAAEIALIAFDNDVAGRDGVRKAMQALGSIFRYVVDIGLAHDPSDYESNRVLWWAIWQNLHNKFGKDSNEFKAAVAATEQSVTGRYRSDWEYADRITLPTLVPTRI